MAAKESPPAANTNHAALVAINDKVITSLSADPLVVAQSLFSRGVIPPGVLESMQQLESKTKRDKAAELMGEVLTKVQNFPANFEVFLEVLNEQLWLKDVVQLIQETKGQFEVRDCIHLFGFGGETGRGGGGGGGQGV